MRLAIQIALFLMLTTAVPARSLSQTSASDDEHELMHLEDVWNHAQVSGDADALSHIWADDLELTVPRMPVMTRDEVLNFARSGRMKFLRYTTSDVRVRVYHDAAVVTGRLQRTRSMNGKEISDDWQFTKVYIREAHEWRVVSFHASDTPEP
ncbi:MAG TPA: nuclear transport factor 2 family protein [Acidobacteriaceae bacterium]|nr:nuclear transport factor 2 family protein [Acidobacteriaceae bacterium]